MSKYFYLARHLLYCFNAILFVLMSVLCVREYGRRGTRWGGYVYAAVVISCAGVYLAKLSDELGKAILRQRAPLVEAVELAGSALLPPLLFHLFYRNEKEHLPMRRAWQVSLLAVYAISATATVHAIATGMGMSHNPLLIAMVGCAAVGSGWLLWISRQKGGALACNQRRWLLGLCAALVSVTLVEIAWDPLWAPLIMDSLPLCFLFVITYYVERFTFFDVLVKRGAFICCSFLLLALYFVFVPAWIAPYLRLVRGTWFGTLLWAATLLPIVLLAPWGHRKLSVWLDRLWLGRRFTPADASKYFLAGLPGAIDEAELVERARQHLEAIFNAPVEVLLDSAPLCFAEGGMEAPVRIQGAVVGRITVRPRPETVRFLSEDDALLSSLAEAFSFLLENLRLHEKRLEQEKREQELVLTAQRSELKALRAQVNPHFLFNALNTIAALIPRHPGRAEETIEQLAEVFRYTLRRSDREWVRVGEELEAVHAYLDIEQARFGSRMQFHVQAGEGAETAWIPAMIVQTLVENAVKHGIAALSTAGVIKVRVELAAPGVLIEVRDNGPGFEQGAESGGGYGLRNIRERLRGYFGDSARLHIGRDEAQGMTVLRVELPRAQASETAAL